MSALKIIADVKNALIQCLWVLTPKTTAYRFKALISIKVFRTFQNFHRKNLVHIYCFNNVLDWIYDSRGGHVSKKKLPTAVAESLTLCLSRQTLWKSPKYCKSLKVHFVSEIVIFIKLFLALPAWPWTLPLYLFCVLLRSLLFSLSWCVAHVLRSPALLPSIFVSLLTRFLLVTSGN